MARRLMPDIAVCMGRLEGGLKPACPIRLKCHRFMAAADPHWRLYFDGRYKDGGCDQFINSEAQAKLDIQGIADSK